MVLDVTGQHTLKSHLQGSTDLHHIILLHYSNSEVVGLHEFLQQSPVVFILTSWKQNEGLDYLLTSLKNDDITVISL